MKRFIINISLFCAIFFAYDKVFFVVANKSAEVVHDKRLGLLLAGEINKDLIIMGSSRGARAIIASQIEDETGLSAYNISYRGSDIDYHEFTLRTLLKFNTPPSYLFLVIDDSLEFLPNERHLLFRKECLYPLVKHPYIWKELAERENKEVLLSQLLFLNRLNISNFDLRRKPISSKDTILDCGSMPVSFQKKKENYYYDFEEKAYPIEKEDPEKVELFRNILQLCQSNQIKLTIIFPPNYKIHSIGFEDRIRQLGGDNIDYFVYDDQNPFYRNTDYFYDERHLKVNGATMFTNEIINYIKVHKSFNID